MLLNQGKPQGYQDDCLGACSHGHRLCDRGPFQGGEQKALGQKSTVRGYTLVVNGAVANGALSAPRHKNSGEDIGFGGAWVYSTGRAKLRGAILGNCSQGAQPNAGEILFGSREGK